MHNSLHKVFELINKTGDRCIVLSPDFNDAYAVMSLDEYERMVFRASEVATLTEDELLDKINRDIAVWKSQQEIDADDVLVGGSMPQNSDITDSDEPYPQSGNMYDDWDEEEEDEDEYYFEAV